GATAHPGDRPLGLEGGGAGHGRRAPCDAGGGDGQDGRAARAARVPPGELRLRLANLATTAVKLNEFRRGGALRRQLARAAGNGLDLAAGSALDALARVFFPRGQVLPAGTGELNGHGCFSLSQKQKVYVCCARLFRLTRRPPLRQAISHRFSRRFVRFIRQREPAPNVRHCRRSPHPRAGSVRDGSGWTVASASGSWGVSVHPTPAQRAPAQQSDPFPTSFLIPALAPPSASPQAHHFIDDLQQHAALKVSGGREGLAGARRLCPELLLPLLHQTIRTPQAEELERLLHLLPQFRQVLFRFGEVLVVSLLGLGGPLGIGKGEA